MWKSMIDICRFPFSVTLSQPEVIDRQAESDKREISRQKDIAQANEQAAMEREAETKAVLEFVENRVFAAARPEGQEGGLVSLASIPALNSRSMLGKPLTHLLVGPGPFKGVGVAMIVFGPRSQHVGLEFLLAVPGRTLQVVVFERMYEDLCLV